MGLVLARLCANVAKADSIAGPTGPTVSGFDLGTADSGLSGWFFNPSQPQSFPSEPDPSQTWTSPENIATLEYWLSLVVELGNDPSLLTQLYGFGMISSPNFATAQTTLADLENSQQTPGNVPEPLTLLLIGGGLAFFGLYGGLWGQRFGDAAELRSTPLATNRTQMMWIRLLFFASPRWLEGQLQGQSQAKAPPRMDTENAGRAGIPSRNPNPQP